MLTFSNQDYLGEFDVSLEEVFANGQPTQEVGYLLRWESSH